VHINNIYIWVQSWVREPKTAHFFKNLILQRACHSQAVGLVLKWYTKTTPYAHQPPSFFLNKLFIFVLFSDQIIHVCSFFWTNHSCLEWHTNFGKKLPNFAPLWSEEPLVVRMVYFFWKKRAFFGSLRSGKYLLKNDTSTCFGSLTQDCTHIYVYKII